MFVELGAPGLTSAGTGEMYNDIAGTGMRTCIELVITRLTDGSFLVDAPFLAEFARATQAFLVDKVSEDELVLTTEQGETIGLLRQPAPPAAIRCEPVQPTATIALASVADFRSNLAADGLDIWFHSGTDLVPLTTTTGNEGAPIDVSGLQFDGFDNPQSVQASDFWLLRNSGGSFEIQRKMANGSTIDSINADLDLGKGVHLRGATWDGTHLWLVGGNPDHEGATTRILQVDSDAEPDTIINEYLWPGLMYAATVKDGIAWGLVYGIEQPMLVSLDPMTGLATKTRMMPADHYWHGLTWVGDTLYILGVRDADGASVMIVVPSV